MECQYCKKIFTTKSSLNQHQTKAKYCLEIQGKNNDNFKCRCGKTFGRKHHLVNHQEICQIINTPELLELKQENLLLQQKISSLENNIQELKKDKETLMIDYAKLAAISANKSTITNNTMNNLNLSVFDKTQEDIKRIVEENYDKNYLIEGQKGVARFAHLHVLKNEDSTKPPIYLITDKSRGNAKYKISETEVVTDIGMNGLTKKIHPSIKKKAILIAANDNFENQEIFDGYQEVFNMDEDNGIFRKELIKILENTE